MVSQLIYYKKDTVGIMIQSYKDTQGLPTTNSKAMSNPSNLKTLALQIKCRNLPVTSNTESRKTYYKIISILCQTPFHKFSTGRENFSGQVFFNEIVDTKTLNKPDESKCAICLVRLVNYHLHFLNLENVLHSS